MIVIWYRQEYKIPLLVCLYNNIQVYFFTNIHCYISYDSMNNGQKVNTKYIN